MASNHQSVEARVQKLDDIEHNLELNSELIRRYHKVRIFLGTMFLNIKSRLSDPAWGRSLDQQDAQGDAE